MGKLGRFESKIVFLLIHILWNDTCLTGLNRFYFSVNGVCRGNLFFSIKDVHGKKIVERNFFVVQLKH